MAAETGHRLAALDSRVDARPHLLFIWNSFGKLSTERGLGFGAPGPIPDSAIENFAARRRVVDRERFGDLIRQMDRVWLASITERAKGAADGNAQ